MTALFEELDYRETPLGELTLRRRSEPRADNVTVYEVKLGDAFLMSSLFTAGERALADLALAGLADTHGDSLDVLVGGLGLGYTAAAALGHGTVASVLVIEHLGAVVEWHRRGLVPLGETLVADERCRLVNGDFFALARSPDGFDFSEPRRRFHAVLLDVDHSPRHWLDAGNAAFYTLDGLNAMQRFLVADGLFAMWSNDAPDDEFLALLREAFHSASATVVEFDNPYTGESAACTIYRARSAADGR
jgi:spermidine synthase